MHVIAQKRQGPGKKERVRHGTPRKEHGRTSRIQVKRDVPGRIDITACAYFPGEHFSNPCDHIFVRFPGIPLCGSPSVKADQGRACIQKPPAELLRSQGVAGRTFAYLRPYRETEACKGLHHGKSRIRVFQEAGSRSFFQHLRHGAGHIYAHGTKQCPLRQRRFSSFRERIRVSGKKLHDHRSLSGKHLQHRRCFPVCPEQPCAADHFCMGR